MLVLLRWQWHPVVPAPGAALSGGFFRKSSWTKKKPGIFLIHLHRPHTPSSLSAFALSRMYLSGFICPGSSYCLFLSICVAPAWWVSLFRLTSLAFTVGGISCSNKPLSHCSAPLLYNSVKILAAIPFALLSNECWWLEGTVLIWVFFLFQGVHESKGVTEDYLKLESLIQKVVSPYLGTYGLYSSDGPFTHSSCILGKNNRGLVWHSPGGFTKTLVHTGPGPTQVEAATNNSIWSGSFSKITLFAMCNVTVDLYKGRKWKWIIITVLINQSDSGVFSISF